LARQAQLAPQARWFAAQASKEMLISNWKDLGQRMVNLLQPKQNGGNNLVAKAGAD
jgi:hypothetical protein